MKNLFKILLSIFLVSVLSLSVLACNKESGDATPDRTVEPLQFSYELEEDEDSNQTYVLTELSLSAAAKEYVDDADWAELAKLFNEYYKVTTYTAENVRFVTIADEYEGIPVTRIAANAIANQTFITELTVPSSITEIELGAFPGLTSLKKITLPFVGNKKGAISEGKLFGYIFGSLGGSNLTSVTQNYNDGTSNNTATYYVPTSLETVIVTGEVIAEETTVEYYIDEVEIDGVNQKVQILITEDNPLPADKEKLELKSFSYDNSAVQPFAFYGITTIKSFEFASCEEIPDYTFYGCSSIKNLTFADGISSIGKYAFANCTSLRVLDFNEVTIIREGAFNGCTSLGRNSATKENTLDFTSIVSIGKDAFAGCTSLNKEKIKNLKITADEAFDKDFFKDEE